MGTVLRGRDPRDGRDVAIKLLLAAQGAREEQRRRFAREAESLARLRHPGIVGVLGAGEEQGTPFLVMDHVAGGTLEERLGRQGPLRPAEAADVVRRVAEALAHAHAHGVVHRDVKPSNILLGPAGPRLTDFGLVRDLDPARSRLTRTGVVLGTPGFLAPEQVGAEEGTIDARTDVYGLGATLHAALTGEPPVVARDMAELLVATLERPVERPSRKRAGISPGLDAICLRCLAKEPDERFASADEVARALADPDAHAPRGRAGPLVPGLVGLALLACGAAAVAVRRAPAPGGDATTAGPAGAGSRPPARTTATETRSTAERAATGSTTEQAAPRPPTEAPAPGESVASRVERWFELGGARLTANDLDGARGAYDNVIQLDPTHVKAHANRAIVRLRQGDAAGALADASRAVELAPEDAGMVYNRAVIHERTGDRTAAIADYGAALALDPTMARAHANRGAARERNGDAEGAIEDYIRAIELDAADGNSYYNRAILRARRGDVEGALEDYARAIDLMPMNAGPLLNRGILRAGSDPAGAQDDLTRAIAAAPGLAQAYAARGIVRSRAGDARGAEADMTRALELDPKDVLSLASRAGVRFLERARWDEALADATRAIDLAKAAPAYAVRAAILAARGHTAEAIADYEALLAVAPPGGAVALDARRKLDELRRR